MLLAGQKVVVVGGSSGIGLATAELARQEGAEVVIASRNMDRLAPVAEKIGAAAIVADVTSDDSVTALFKAVGVVDHVVVTAAQLRSGPFKTVPMEDVRATMEGKFWAPGGWRVRRRSATAARSRWSRAFFPSGRDRIPRSSARQTARSKRWRGASRSSSRRCA